MAGEEPADEISDDGNAEADQEHIHAAPDDPAAGEEGPGGP